MLSGHLYFGKECLLFDPGILRKEYTLRHEVNSVTHSLKAASTISIHCPSNWSDLQIASARINDGGANAGNSICILGIVVSNENDSYQVVRKGVLPKHK